MRTSTNRDRIRCFKCREYDHIAKDCLNSDKEKESKQIQQMFNLDKDKVALKVLVEYTYDDHIRTNSDDALDHLDLQRVRMTLPHFPSKYKNRWTS